MEVKTRLEMDTSGCKGIYGLCVHVVYQTDAHIFQADPLHLLAEHRGHPWWWPLGLGYEWCHSGQASSVYRLLTLGTGNPAFSCLVVFTSEGEYVLYVFSCAWFFSLNVRSSGSIHVAANIRVSFFLWPEYSILYIYHIFSTYSSTDEHFCWSHILAFVNTAVINMGIQIFFDRLILRWYCWCVW